MCIWGNCDKCKLLEVVAGGTFTVNGYSATLNERILYPDNELFSVQSEESQEVLAVFLTFHPTDNEGEEK